MASATCEVREGADGSFVGTTNGVDVGVDAEITIRLASGEGVRNWTIECIGTDELGSVDEINDALSVDSAARTATFTAPSVEGRALLFRSTIFRHNGASSAETFGVFIPMASGRRVGALNQTYEGNATHGWVTTINDLIRNGAYGDLTVIRQDTVATTDATPTIIPFDYTGIAAIPDDCVVACTATVLARDTDDGSKFLRLELARTMAVVGGTGTFNGSTREFDGERLGIAGTAVATIGRDAGTLRPYVEVTGIAARNFDWKAILQYDTLEPLGEVTPPAPFDIYALSWSYLVEGDNLVGDASLTGTASGGLSGGRDWASTSGAGLAAGGTFGTHASIDWASHAGWTFGEAILSDLVSAQDWQVVIIADIQGFTATGTNFTDSKQIIRTNSGTYFGIGLLNNGANDKLVAGCYSGAYKHVTYPAAGNAATGKQVIQWQCIAGVQRMRVNKGAWVTGDAVTAISSLTDYLRNDEGAGPGNLDMALFGVSLAGMSDTVLDNICDLAASEYGVTL